MARRGNYSAKLRQEREGAGNTLRTDGDHSRQKRNAGNSEATGRKTGTHNAGSRATGKSDQTLRKPGNWFADSAVEDLNQAVRDADEDENIGVEALTDTKEGAANTLRFGQEVNYRRKLHQKQKAEKLTDDSGEKISGKGAVSTASSADGSKTGTGKKTGAGKKTTEIRQPGSWTADRISSGVHQSIREANTDENTGVEAAVDLEEGAENTLRFGREVNYRRKLRSQKKSTQDFQKATGGTASSRKAQTNRSRSGGQTASGTAEKGTRTGGSTASNPLSRWRQRQNLKQLYAARRAGTTESAGSTGVLYTTQLAAEKVRKTKKKLEAFVHRHSQVILAILLFLVIITLIAGMISSCSAMSTGTGNAILGTSYTAEDEDILAVEEAYCLLEQELGAEIETIETDYPGYDEYNYDISEIGHDPYQLAALLTVLLEDYTVSEASGYLQTIFDLQYELELEEVVEMRTETETRTGYRTVTDPETGELTVEAYTYEVEVEVEYRILNVTLTNVGISGVVSLYGALLGLTDDQLERYWVLVETLGNREYLFSDVTYATSAGTSSGTYLDYEVSAEALTDTEFANMIAEAEKYLGMAYVWGGSSPSTGFDCSGFVCWVINNCGNGWYVGRTTANGLLSYCTVVSEDDLQPGDLVFFENTYNTTGASHVGIYVGNGMMIHCGDPISYTSIETTYWQSHLLCYGRLNQ